MTKFLIFAVGSIILFFMEAGLSIALRRYDLPGHHTPFLRGPITTAFTEITERHSESSESARVVRRDARGAAKGLVKTRGEF